ncbi:MAG TPA: enoyl-CoA hydratase/isomerase family protein [bacterium]|nr:enoyl-CoA hydratase/isomerase family protein [bacterium]
MPTPATAGSAHMLFDVEGGVARLTVNRPEQRNAMTWAMYQRLVEICEEVDRDDRIRVLVVTGAGGRAFISGTDISQFPAFRGNPQAGIEYEERIDEVTGRLEAVGKPTIASIRGFAVGGGMGIAMTCDLRIASEDSRFGIPVIRLGNCLSMNNYARMVALIGPARAKEMIFTARHVEAREALAWGLVNEVVPPEILEARTRELAEAIAAAPPLTLRASKEAVRRVINRLLPESRGHDLIGMCYNSADFQEGVAAFLDKRTPRWTGR